MYECSYQLVGFDKNPTSIFGVTPIQAVHLALKLISTEMVGLMKSYRIADERTGMPLTAELVQVGMQ